MAYDFTTLSPDDFENLIADLLSREWKSRVEAFKAGKDAGIDLRNSRVLAGKKPTIIQCKRYAPNKFPELRRTIREEKRKLDRIKPGRYVLATSIPLSPANKDQLIRLLAPWCESPGDIYGASEVNGLLRDHPDVERAHFKLWVSSTAILERILHSRIFNVTQATLESTKDYMSRIVMHEGFNRALEMLRQEHHVLIVGNPGIGKTTLARVLLCHYVRENFEPICVTSNIEDAWELVHGSVAAKRNMVVFYDDFLGRLRFDSQRFGKNEEHSLIEFLNKVRHSTNLRLILTTREYILADAKRVHGAFDSHASEILKYTLSLEEYSRPQRAKMLFNHLYFSDLPDSRLESFVRSKAYRTIIFHDHFNPRIVETISNNANSRAMSDEEYLRFVESEFDNPARIWEHPFRNDISPIAQEVLAVLWTFGGIAELEALTSSVLQMHPRGGAATAMTLTDAIRQLDGNFISTNRHPLGWREDKHAIVAQFQNPSVEEFIENLILSERRWIEQLVEAITCFEQAQRLAVRASSYLPEDSPFWPGLRAAAASVEGTRRGRLINRWLGPAVTSAWEVGRVTHAGEVQTLLEIERKLGTDDARFAELQSRVTTAAGWANLASGVFTDYEVLGDLKRLTDWVQKESRWPAKIKAQSRRTFREIVNQLVSDEEEVWAASISTLRALAEMISSGESPLTDEEKAVFSNAATVIVDTIDENSNDPGDVYAEQRQLQRLEKICKIDLQKQDNELDRIAERLAERQDDEPQDDPDRNTAASEAEDAFDVDALFVGLLER
jgi:hypothetical protein